ncbi:trifunctional serine/threonine-protein kinase/ATP-binding protein/sensor histidine kinase [Lusitaniella coriacea]|uniref:trifunctional serine/threonine-protein kinase/ATP-binding protein/sensor histidine kinase n=1 Tax=Lusitaniella coriacea TaxID=1983105 RepID=UPI003CF11C89
MTSTLVTLPNYQLTEQIYEGTRTVVYRGQEVENETPIVIKLMRSEYPSFRELMQFRNQYAITKNLEIEGIIQSIALERYENRYALIMEDTGGISLAEYKQQSSLSLQQFLNIAIQIAEILQQLHNNSIIHKDIKPANILIHPKTNQIKLIDFSISTLLPKETQTLQNPNILEGTLSYLSPEQTGRMNRGIDYRSDFYSLGVTFYELLAGKLPFHSDDPLELIHAHIAENPKLIGDICPQPLSDIVMKLMAKNAEERYQSALGLKYDLEKCLTQYQETGTIESFELGERDICDRFLIPEKLYGRETEVAQLLAAFERVATGNTEMMLVAGFSGIGKTAVVNEVHKPIVRQRGYFIKGKFDQFNRNIPFSAFVQAFRDLMGQLLCESDDQLEQWKVQILQALGENGQVIIEVIPELEGIIGQQPPVPELSGSAAQNRFNLLFGKFVRVFATKEHPLVIFLDDLQWADSASLNLMQLLMGTTDTSHLLFVGAYRDNEVFPAHPFMLALDRIGKAGGIFNTITLKALSLEDLNQLVADTLTCSLQLALPLTELIWQKTKGNPFFTVQFLKGLYEDELITFDSDLGSWQCDMASVTQLSLTDDVIEFMGSQLQKLPSLTQEMLKFAACVGNIFDLDTLAIVSDRSREDVATALWRALQEGFVLPKSKVYKFYQSQSDNFQSSIPDDCSIAYQFLHDRVQQAAYSLIQSDRKQFTHLKIGRRLLDNTPEETLDEKIFEIVNQLNIGIESADAAFDIAKLARLNLRAGQQAKATTAYQAAVEYFAVARNLIPTLSWEENYTFTLNLYRESAEAAYLSAEFEEMEKFVEIVKNRALTLLDAVSVYEVKMQAGMAQNKLPEAIQTGRDILCSLGIVFPENPNPSDIEATISAIFSKIAGKNPMIFIELPSMTDPEKLASIRILQGLAPCAYQAMPMLLPLVVIKQVELSLDYGNSPLSPLGYAFFALILCGVVGDIETGYKFGELALALLDRSDAKEIQTGTIFVVNADVKHYREAVQNTLQPLQSAYALGLETGNLEFAALSTSIYVYHAYLVGRELPDLEQELENYNQTLKNLKQKTALYFNQILQQSVSNLIGVNDEPCKLEGAVYNALEMLPVHQQANDATAIYYVYFNQMILCYLLGEFHQAVENAAKAEQYLYGVTANLVVPIFYFYDSLIQLASSKIWAESKREDKLEKAIEKVRSNQEKMQNWANYAPMNFQHKYDLVEAEKHRVLGDKLEALEYYDRAISGAKENEYLQEEALANELFAKFYLDWGRGKEASVYMQDAYYCYAQWGAKAKTDDLEQRYPELLKPILHRAPQSGSLSSTSLSTVTSHSQTASVVNISNLLDFSSLLKASQTLSGEIELSPLLSTLMKIILENAGATKGALLLASEQGLTVDAIATRQNEDLQLNSVHQSIPLDDYPDLPSGLINTVRRTAEIVLLDAKTAQKKFTADRYLQRFSPQSLLCMPLLERGNLIGILYLENTLTANAFTRDRVELLDALCAQAAISLSNARLYQKAQQALQDLQAAQLQLVQNEKMATLGNLVAGVAHEINNPVGFIGGNVSAAQEYLQDLLDIITLYQDNASLPESIIEEIEDLDLDFIAEDFPKLIASMQTGCERIRNISTSLRTFSRTDTDKKTEFNVHEGIESTLLILKYRLKANEERPAIEITKEYGDLPEVQCFPGQLNQVFMNLIANAIDALDEFNEGQKFEEIEANPNRITIQTEVSGEHAIVRIGDNGKGMPDEMRQCIFKQGFTTKGVGKGTGLGLAIARQIITEKHGGSLAVQSVLGKGTQFCIRLPISD